MEKITNDISKIIIAEISTVNEKVKGLNFLELLKPEINSKLSQLLNLQKFPLEQQINHEEKIENASQNINILINYFINPISISKKKLDHDSLFLIFNEHLNIDIYKDEKNFKSILLYKNTGITLPKDSIINAKYNKNHLIIEIACKNSQQILTK